MNLLLILNYFYLNISMFPTKQLFYLIIYTIFSSINIMILLPSMSLNLLIILIIFISGILVLFSYFICLLNNSNKKKTTNISKLILINLMIIMISIIQLMNNKLLLKNLNFNFHFPKNQMIKKLYLTPNYFFMISFIIILIYMLFMVTKMCYIQEKPLRTYKWKK
nr:TPA_asm: ND6 [Bombus convexus]